MLQYHFALNGDSLKLKNRLKLFKSIWPTLALHDELMDCHSQYGDLADSDRVGDRLKQSDIISVSDTAKLMENESGNVGATEPGFTALPMTDEWGHGLDKSRLHGTPPISNDKKEGNRWIAGNTGANMHSSQSLGTMDIWPGDAEMSPDWNYKTGSSSHMEEDAQNKRGIIQDDTYLAIYEQDIIQLAPGQSINQNAQNVNPLHTSNNHAVGQSQLDVCTFPSREGTVDATHSREVSSTEKKYSVEPNPLHTSSSHAVGQSQLDVRTFPSREGTVDATRNQEASTEKKHNVEPNIMDSGLSQVGSINPPTQNAVSNEQLAQLTDLSASRAHILGPGQQLPQLYAALNSHDLNDSPSQANTQVSAMPVSNTCIKPDPVVGLSKQYDPMNGSNEQKNADASGVPLTIPPSKNISKVEILPHLSNSGKQIYGDSIKGASSELIMSDNLIRLQPGHNIVVYNNFEVTKSERIDKNTTAFKKNDESAVVESTSTDIIKFADFDIGILVEEVTAKSKNMESDHNVLQKNFVQEEPKHGSSITGLAHGVNVKISFPLLGMKRKDNKVRDGSKGSLKEKNSDQKVDDFPGNSSVKTSKSNNNNEKQTAFCAKVKERPSGNKVVNHSLAGPHKTDDLGSFPMAENNTALEMIPTAVAAPQRIAEDWVACDRCQKWRLLPTGLKPEQLPEKWLCVMLNWLPGMNSCDFSEDETTKALYASY
ncbi:hypothetical protein RYX36_034774 [Vicia faba]